MSIRVNGNLPRSITFSPSTGDKITVTYNKEIRGTVAIIKALFQRLIAEFNHRIMRDELPETTVLKIRLPDANGKMEKRFFEVNKTSLTSVENMKSDDNMKNKNFYGVREVTELHYIDEFDYSIPQREYPDDDSSYIDGRSYHDHDATVI